MDVLSVFERQASNLWGVSLVPDPHPLDYDWRFDDSTVSDLVQHLGPGRVLLMGCPSIAMALAEIGRPSWLVDRQPFYETNDLVSAAMVDLRYEGLEQLQLGLFDTILIDSPWYVDYLTGWLWEALRHSLPGGQLMFSLWPGDVRPGAIDEAGRMLVQASIAGRPSVESGALGYRTPPFELAAAAATGRKLLGAYRRRGDLVTITGTKMPMEMPAPPARANIPSTIWERFVFDRTQVALRVRSKRELGEPRLIELAPGGILPDVSRRLPMRAEIDLWTSDNLAFRLEGSSHFLLALEKVMTGTCAGAEGATLTALKLLLAHDIVETCVFRRTYRWQHFA